MTPRSFIAVAVLMLVIALTGASYASASADPIPQAGQVPAPKELRHTSEDPDNVALVWKPGDSSSSDPVVHVLRAYIVKRDGKVIEKLYSIAGVAKTTYVDNPGKGTFTYTIVAQYFGGARSYPSNAEKVTTTAPAADSPVSTDPDPAADLSSGWCDDVKTPNLINGNKPTPFEVYGCTPPMTFVPDRYGEGGIPLIKDAKDLPKSVQSGYLSNMISQGTAWFLLGNSFYAWSLQSGSYTGFEKFGASLVSGLRGNTNYYNLLLLCLIFMVGGLGISVLTLQVKQFLIKIFIVFASMTALAVLVSAPFIAMNMAAKPILWANSVQTGSMAGFLHGTDADSGYKFVVRPTFNGNDESNNIRKAAEQRWVMQRYLPLCAVVFGDAEWAAKTFMPGTKTTWCEGYLRAQLKTRKYDRTYTTPQGAYKIDFKDDQNLKDWEDALKKADENRYNFYSGGDLGKRQAYTFFSEAASAINTLYFVLYTAVIAGAIILLVLDIVLAIFVLPGMSSVMPGALRFGYRHAKGMEGKFWNAVQAGFAIFLINVGSAVIYNITSSFGYLGQQISMLAYATAIVLLMISIWWRRRKQRKAAHVAAGGREGGKVAALAKAGATGIAMGGAGAIGTAAVGKVLGSGGSAGAAAGMTQAPPVYTGARTRSSARFRSHPPNFDGTATSINDALTLPATTGGPYGGRGNSPRPALPPGTPRLPPGSSGGTSGRPPADGPPSNGGAGPRGPSRPSSGGGTPLPDIVVPAVDVPTGRSSSQRSHPRAQPQLPVATGGGAQAPTITFRDPGSGSGGAPSAGGRSSSPPPAWRPPPRRNG